MDEDSTVNKSKKTKSKSFVQEQIISEKSKGNKSFDIASLHNKAGKKEQVQNETPKRLNKKHKQLLNDSKVTSTPINSDNKSLKSIMKNTPVTGEVPVESYTPDFYVNKRKKRNKSVSFVLEEEVATKKSKSVDTASEKSFKKSPKKYAVSPVQEKSRQKEKKNKTVENCESEQSEKENINESNRSTPTKVVNPEKAKTKPVESLPEPVSTTDNSKQETEKPKNKKVKKNKKPKPDITESTETKTTSKVVSESTSAETKAKKNKKKKRKAKRTNSLDSGEPLSKTRKQETEATVIAEDLENLSIGDNPHTLTNLLDDMTVADKNKKKKNKTGKVKTGKSSKDRKTSTTSTDELGLENIEEGKEKVKWKKRKWNKDKKADTNDLLTSVIVENLPIKIMLNYKKLLSELFSKCGVIKGIGIAEVYPTEDSKPVFTTTINFTLENDATKALEEDNTTFAGCRIRVKRPLPPSATTLAVKTYGELTEQAVSSAFTPAGRIRNIRHLLKGKKSMSTAFVEFDGPQAVERALKMAADIKIGGKKTYVSKYEVRSKKPTTNGKDVQNQDSSSDSDDE